MSRRHIPDAQKELIREMLENGMPVDDVVKYGHISDRVCRRVRETYTKTGKVSRKAVFPGRPRALGDLPLAVSTDYARIYHDNDIRSAQYLEARIEQNPDLSLGELRQALILAHAIDVSERTISASLKRRGFTRKRVCKLACLL